MAVKTVLVVGAGKSSLFLIENLLQHASAGGYRVVVADADEAAAASKVAGHAHGHACKMDAADAAARRTAVEGSNVVCSLLPPTLHHHLAADCLAVGVPIITASYVSPEMRALDAGFRAAGLTALCEMGLDPGIDHMSAMDIIHRIQASGGAIHSFQSHCGGLVAPESDDNPWHYKFSWNPWNVVTAGQGGARYIAGGEVMEVPYPEQFFGARPVQVEGVGQLGGYANRDSTTYPALYGLEGARTFIRTTLRHFDFLRFWPVLDAIRLTSTAEKFPTAGLSPAGYVGNLLRCPADRDLRVHIASAFSTQTPADQDYWVELEERLEAIGIFSDEPLTAYGIAVDAAPAEVLLHLLLRHWAMRPEDRDMVVMQHELGWTTAEGTPRRTTSTLVLKGENSERTAMAKTVGLPMAIAARMLLDGRAGDFPRGVCIPTEPAIYEPVLRELVTEGIVFTESES